MAGNQPEPVTDDDEFSECQNSMFIFQIPRLVRNWNFEQNNQTFPKKQTAKLLIFHGSNICPYLLALEETGRTFYFASYFFSLLFFRKVKNSEIGKNCTNQTFQCLKKKFEKVLSGKEEERTRRRQ